MFQQVRPLLRMYIKCLFIYVVLNTLCLAQTSSETLEYPVIQRAYVHFHEHAAIAFQRGGTIIVINAREGDQVRKGDIIARLDDLVATRSLAIAKENAQSEVKVRIAEADAELADLELKVVHDANRRTAGTYPGGEVARRRIAAERARLQVDFARHELRVAQLTESHAEAELQTYRIIAPYDAVITKLHTAVGNSVQPNEKVIELAKTNEFRVQGYVPYRHAWRMSTNDLVTVRITDPDLTKQFPVNEFQGKLKFVEAQAEDVRRVVGVWALIHDPTATLKDGMSAEMRIRCEPNRAEIAEGGHTSP